MKIELTPHLATLVMKRMATGDYATEAEALESLTDERPVEGTAYTVGEIRALLKPALEELDRGEGIPLDEVRAELRAKLDNARK